MVIYGWKLIKESNLNWVLSQNWFFYKSIFLLLIVMLSACGASLNRPEISFGKLVDYDCKPVAGARIRVKNTIPHGYLFPGDNETMLVTSDENGLFPFDVSTNADYISLDIIDGRTNSPSRTRMFGKKVDYYNSRQEIEAITHSSKDSPIFIYHDRNGTPTSSYTAERERLAISGQFNHRYNRQALSDRWHNLAYIRFGKDETRNLIIIDASTGGDISTITNVTTRGVDVKDTVSTHIIEVNKKGLKKLFYIRSGKKNLAAIISMTVDYISVSDSISIQYYIQRVPSVAISKSRHFDINLEECGGYMNRGVFGYYSKFTDEQKRRIEPLTKPQKSDPVKRILNDIGFVNSQKQLKLLLNHKLLNDSLLEGLIEYNFISSALIDDLYDFVRKNNWKRAANRLAIDPRTNEPVIVDFINRLPAAKPWLVKNLISYINNYSSGSSVVVSAIAKFKEGDRTNEESNEFIRSILQKGVLHSTSSGTFESTPEDLKIIHEFVMENSVSLLQDYNNIFSVTLLSGSIYVPATILEKVYFHDKNNNDEPESLYLWASNPNTPLSVLTDMLNILLAVNPDIGVNSESFQKFIAALVDNPNSDRLLKKRLFRTLTDKNINPHFLKYFIKPGLAIAKTTPESVFSQLVDDALYSKYDSGYSSSRLLSNPMLPLALSEKLVAKYGCLNNINETYAQAHFKTMPDKSCYSAAVDSKVTPNWIKRRIMKNKYNVSEYSSSLEKEYIPPEQMKFLYCLHTDSVKHKLLKNPYTTENILVDIFNNHQQSILISDLAENPATPQWILDRIYRNDYSSPRNFDREVDAKLLCNSMIPDSVKRHLKYQYHGSNCRKLLQTKAVLEYIKQRKRISEPLICDTYKKKKLELLKPEATILGYGEIIFKPTNEATYQIVNSAENIKAKKGTRIGVHFILKGDEYSRAFGNDVEIESVLTFQAEGGINKEESKNKIMQSLNRPSFFSYTFSELSDIEKGKWIFELRYRGAVLLKKTLITQ